MILSLRPASSTLIAVFATVVCAGYATAENIMHGRVSYTDQSALVKGVDDSDWSYAGVNSLIMPGDTVWADDESALEIEFSGGTFLRLADGSRLDVVDVPPSALFRGTTGSFYVQRVRRSTGDAVFDTPAGAIEIAPDTQVRVDIFEEGATTVTVRWGDVSIHAEGGEPVNLRAGERSFIEPGFLPSAPLVFDRSEEDAFDTWNRSRARQLAEGSVPTPIQSSYSGGAPPMGINDLNGYGEWVYIDGVAYWRPTVAEYVPYRYGSWSYVPAQGYVWVDYYPWAYVTTHYGHWAYYPRYGWCWRYAGYYRPAFAYTLHYGDMFVWAPLGYYGYPVCYDSYASFYLGGVRFSYGFSSFCYDRYVWGGGYYSIWFVDYHHIYDHHHHHHYKDCDYWRIDTDSSPYKNSGRPHWPGDREGTFAPERVYRGTTTTADGSSRARDRAQTLEARQPVTRSNGNVVRTARTPASTPTSPAARQAATRQVRIAEPSAARLARGGPDDTGPQTDAIRTRTYTNRDAGGAAPLSRGSLAEGGTPSDRVRPTSPSQRTVGDRPEGLERSRPISPQTAPRPSSRPQRPGGEPVAGIIEDFPSERPRPTTTRPSVPSTERGGQPVFGGVEDPVYERPRATSTRPQVPESRPQSTRSPAPSQKYNYPTRQPFSGPEPTRPSYDRPQPAPQVARPEPSRPSYDRPQPQASMPQPSRPTYDRPQSPVNQPAPSRPSYDRPQAQPGFESRPSAPGYSQRSFGGSPSGSSGRSYVGAPSSSRSSGGGPTRSR